jgi:hypothetical protein
VAQLGVARYTWRVNLKPSPLAFTVFLLAGWISRQQLVVIEYLKAENRMLRERLKGCSLRFSDRERALVARKAFGIPRQVLLELGTIVIPIRCCAGTGN